MTCWCAANSLTLFVRSVAHVDLGPLLLSSQSFALLQSSERQIRGHQRSNFSSAGKPTFNNDVFMDITPDAIDSLAAEAFSDSQAPAAVQEGRFKITRDYLGGGREQRRAENASTHTRAGGGGQQFVGRPQSKHTGTSAISPRSAWRETPSGWRPVPRDQKAQLSYEEKGKLKQSERPSPEKRDREYWQIQKAALKAKFGGEAWNPRKRLSPDALAGIRAIHSQFPEEYSTEVLATKFEVSPEMIRRILKSKWSPNSEEEIDRQQRWFKRGEKVWKHYASQGVKPPKRWREAGVQEGPGLGERRRMGMRRHEVSRWHPDEIPKDITTERMLPGSNERSSVSFV